MSSPVAHKKDRRRPQVMRHRNRKGMVAAGCALPEQEPQAAAGRVLPEKGTGGSRGLCTTPEQELLVMHR